jgi:hypothetical protein
LIDAWLATSGHAGRPLLCSARSAVAHADPHLNPERKLELVRDLMRSGHAVKEVKSSGDLAAEAAAHKAVDLAKRALGERGPIWWRS